MSIQKGSSAADTFTTRAGVQALRGEVALNRGFPLALMDRRAARFRWRASMRCLGLASVDLGVRVLTLATRTRTACLRPSACISGSLYRCRL